MSVVSITLSLGMVVLRLIFVTATCSTCVRVVLDMVVLCLRAIFSPSIPQIHSIIMVMVMLKAI